MLGSMSPLPAPKSTVFGNPDLIDSGKGDQRAPISRMTRRYRSPWSLLSQHLRGK
jgi:hypothetical protein